MSNRPGNWARSVALIFATSTGVLPFPAPGVEHSEASYESRPHFVVRTDSATYYYDRAGGGFSRLIDRSGRDWINFAKEPLNKYPASAAAGYRGVPNLLFGSANPDAGAGHPGFDRCESRWISPNSIRTVSTSERWAWTWTFTQHTATMTMERADPDATWWFLYEGPIAGSFSPTTTFWGTDRGGPRAEIPDRSHPMFDRWRWVYFGDRSAPRVLYLAQHQPDSLDDTLWFLGASDGGAVTAADGMVVFGFGRGAGTRPLFNGQGQQFTLGFLEHPDDPFSDGNRSAQPFHEHISSQIESVLAGSLSEEADPQIHVWFGETQKFGQLGEAQHWVNVLGNLTGWPSHDLTYTLNGAEAQPLTLGTDLHRLALPGDFNIELSWDELRPGTNELLITALGAEPARTNVSLVVERGHRWPLPYHVDFRRTARLQDAVQVVDGRWHLTAEGVRTTEPWYDRVLALGDRSWTNYEARLLVTLHGFTPPQHSAPTYGVTHLGVALRWHGHTADGLQPSRQWYPLGAQCEFLIGNDKNRVRVLHHGGPEPVYGTNQHAIQLTQPFWIKAQVSTLPEGLSTYRFKQWNVGHPEPGDWAVESSEPTGTDYASGALCLVAHHSDVTVHEINVASLNPPPPWPENVREVAIPSTADDTLQRTLFWTAPSQGPLLVALHSWSGDYTQSSGTNYLSRCVERGWHFIHPNFRGVNRRPAATCSDWVVSDILDAVSFAKLHAPVDDKRIYLVGASGGGMAALQMTGKAPQVWAAVSAWVPISDLAAWHAETAARRLYYTDWVEASCGGAPGKNPAVDFQYWNRSPLSFLSRAAGVPLDLNAGIQDGHTGSVPISHSLRAFNTVAAEGDRVPKELIDQMEQNASVPPASRWNSTDSTYGTNTVLFRRESNAARVTLFEGGHEINYDAAFAWLERQSW